MTDLLSVEQYGKRLLGKMVEPRLAMDIGTAGQLPHAVPSNVSICAFPFSIRFLLRTRNCVAAAEAGLQTEGLDGLSQLDGARVADELNGISPVEQDLRKFEQLFPQQLAPIRVQTDGIAILAGVLTVANYFEVLQKAPGDQPQAAAVRPLTLPSVRRGLQSTTSLPHLKIANKHLNIWWFRKS